jgi:hypothetical protein
MRNSKVALALLLLVGLGDYASNSSAQATPISACQTITACGSYLLAKNSRQRILSGDSRQQRHHQSQWLHHYWRSHRGVCDR